MKVQEKYEIMKSRILTDSTFKYIKHIEGHESLPPLNIWGVLLRCLNDQDFVTIRDSNIYLNVMFSPASNSILNVTVPSDAKVISFDYNYLALIPEAERVAILLHEYGHAFNPTMKGDEGEFVADDFAISHGYGESLRMSLLNSIQVKPDLFDKPITHQRISRIN